MAGWMFKLGSHRAIRFWGIEIKNIATFIPRRQRHFQCDIFILPNTFLSPTHSHQTDIITKLRRKISFVKTKRWLADVLYFVWRAFFNFFKVVLLLYHFLSLFPWLFLSKLYVLLLLFFEIFFLFNIQTGIHFTSSDSCS